MSGELLGGGGGNPSLPRIEIEIWIFLIPLIPPSPELIFIIAFVILHETICLYFHDGFVPGPNMVLLVHSQCT